MKAHAITDIGRERSVNQDYVYYSLDKIGNLPNLFILADGMGGHKAGDMASKYTVEQFLQLVSDDDDKNAISIISKTVNKVNELLINKATESEDYTGMGTTLVAATIDGNLLRVANVGDSRLYVIENDIYQITRDHSLVEEMVNLGEIDRKEARTHANKNIITRAIGAGRHVEADMFSVELKSGDRVLMCSDGLTNMLEDASILNIIKNNEDIEEAAKNLVAAANDNGGTDNVSVIIIEP